MIYSGYVDVGVVQPHSWIETGDYAYIQNNQLYLVSRKSDRLIIGVKYISQCNRTASEIIRWN